jgi:hypothetical protein
MLRRLSPRLAEADFLFREDAPQKQLAVLFDHAADAQTFHDFSADADDVHGDASYKITIHYHGRSTGMLQL